MRRSGSIKYRAECIFTSFRTYHAVFWGGGQGCGATSPHLLLCLMLQMMIHGRLLVGLSLVVVAAGGSTYTDVFGSDTEQCSGAQMVRTDKEFIKN